MQRADNSSYQRLPIPGQTDIAPPVPPPAQQPNPAPPIGSIPVSQFVQPEQPAVPPPQQPPTRAEQKQQARQELKQAIGHANEVLISAQTVFPFTLFPDTISIDRGKLTISHRFFFRVAEVTSIRIEDILNAVAHVGPIFGSLKVTTRYFGSQDKEEYNVNYLRRDDTIKIKRILQGYIIALKKQIDCSSLSTAELSRLLLELGSEAPETQ